MVTFTVNLPDKVKALAEARASAAGYTDISDYLAQLIEAEASASAADAGLNSDDELEALLLSRNEGESIKMDAEDFQQLRKKLEDRLQGDARAGL